MVVSDSVFLRYEPIQSKKSAMVELILYNYRLKLESRPTERLRAEAAILFRRYVSWNEESDFRGDDKSRDELIEWLLALDREHMEALSFQDLAELLPVR